MSSDEDEMSVFARKRGHTGLCRFRREMEIVQRSLDEGLDAVSDLTQFLPVILRGGMRPEVHALGAICRMRFAASTATARLL
jgi:hypothetical protein